MRYSAEPLHRRRGCDRGPVDRQQLQCHLPTPLQHVLLIIPHAPDLDGIVEASLVVQQTTSAPISRFPAMPRAMLTVSPAAAGNSVVAFHALSTRPVAHVHGGPFKALGLVLPPVTAAQLIGPSTGALADATLPWAELAGAPEAARLDDELLCANTDADCLRALQDSLRRVLSRGPERVRRSRATALRQLCLSVEQQGTRAASQLGLGERQLERRCQALLGVAPKQMQRLTRFHAVLAGVLRQQRLPDADAALAAGYYDQSHLARDVRQLAGAPLRELLSEAHADGAWWPLATRRRAAR
jgi:AraC-like DNA-binding protein